MGARSQVSSRRMHSSLAALIVTTALLAAACSAAEPGASTTTSTTATMPPVIATTTVPPQEVDCFDIIGPEDAVATAIEAAPRDTVLCLEPGDYGALEVDAQRDAFVVVRSLEPLGARFDEVSIDDASFIRFERILIDGLLRSGQDNSHNIEIAASRLTGVFVEAAPLRRDGPGPSDWVVEYNDIHDCETFCVALVSEDPNRFWPVTNMVVRGNKIGPLDGGEDAIRLHNWRNITIEANEIFGVIEDGQHNDCLQSVWGGSGLVFARNYLHDNNCQTFFLKDGYTSRILFEENLSIRNRAGDAPVVAQIWPSSDVVVRNNTIWDDAGLSLRNGTYSDQFVAGPFTQVKVSNNVLVQFVPYDDQAPGDDPVAFFEDVSVLDEDHNVFGDGWTWVPSRMGGHSVADESPAFRNPTGTRAEDLSVGDWRLSDPVSIGGTSFLPGISWELKGSMYGTAAYPFDG